MGYSNRPIRADSEPARVTDEQRRRIADRALEIAVEYHGKPTSITSTHARFGAKGSLKVNFASQYVVSIRRAPQEGAIEKRTGRIA